MAWSAELIVKYANRTELLAAAAAANKPSNSTLGVVDSELCTFYICNSSTNKWTVCSGNRYETVSMPTETDFDIPDYTRLINVTTGAEFIQQP